MKRKSIKKVLSAIIAFTMMFGSTFPITAYNDCAELTEKDYVMLDGIMAYKKLDGDYYTMVDGKEYMLLILDGEDELIDDESLLAQLDTRSGSSYPTSTWSKQYDYELYLSDYTAHVDLHNGDYESPAFIMNISNCSSTAALTVNYDNWFDIGFDTKDLNTTIYYRTDAGWSAHNICLKNNILIHYHSFDVGDINTAQAIDRMALKFKAQNSYLGAFSYVLHHID